MKRQWKTARLGDLCQTGSGGTPLKAHRDYYEGGTIPWLLSGEVSQGEVRAATTFITRKGLENSSAKLFPPNTVLVAMYGATAGQVGILRFEAATNQAVCGILPNGRFVPEFLYYLLLSKKAELVAQAEGNAQPNISQIKIRNTLVPVVPLSEQKALVDVLTRVSSDIEIGKNNAAANLANARALFASYLDAIFTKRGATWPRKTLADIAETFEDGDWIESKDQSTEGIRLIQTGNIGNGVFKDRAAKARFISEKTFSRLRCTEVFEGDCLISRLPDPVGRCCLLPDTGERMITAVDCSIVRFTKTQVVPEYFVYYTQSNAYLDAVDTETTGTTRNRISRSNLGKIAVPLASVKEQKLIVAELDELSSEIEALQELYRRKGEEFGALKDSLLHHAFTGQL